MMEVVVKTGAIRRAKLQSNRHQQQTNTQLFYGLDAIPVPTNSVKALKVICAVNIWHQQSPVALCTTHRELLCNVEYSLWKARLVKC